MNPSGYFMPNMAMNRLMTRNVYGLSGGIGSLDKIIQGIKNFNWSKLLNGASKTLNVMNQTIPLVRQAGPVINNAKNMFKIVKAFGNETRNKQIINKNVLSERQKSLQATKTIKNSETISNNFPNFFI